MQFWIRDLILGAILGAKIAKYNHQLGVENDIVVIHVDLWGGAGPDCCIAPVLAG